jgi:hypothetical protein
MGERFMQEEVSDLLDSYLAALPPRIPLSLVVTADQLRSVLAAASLTESVDLERGISNVGTRAQLLMLVCSDRLPPIGPPHLQRLIGRAGAWSEAAPQSAGILRMLLRSFFAIVWNPAHERYARVAMRVVKSVAPAAADAATSLDPQPETVVRVSAVV